MKLAKLSLAAIVAVGTMTSFASATPLEEAIKGVDVSGMIRYRFYNYDKETANDERHRFSIPVTFKVPVADNLTAGVTVRSEQNERDTKIYDATGNQIGTSEAMVNPTSDPDTNLVKAWFQYANGGFSLKAGKFELATPWTDPGYGGDRGTGALAMYTGVEGWTFATAGFTQTNIGQKAYEYYALSATDAYRLAPAVKMSGEENLYAVAAIGSMGPVNAQVWVSKMTNVFDYSVFAEASMKMEGFSLKAQVNQLELDGGDNDLFWGAEAGFSMAGFNVGAGYTKNGDDHGVYELSADSSAMIKAGKQIYYKTSNALDAETMFVKAGYSFAEYGVGAGYISAEEGVAAAQNDWDEFYVEGSYKYSKNFGLSAYYSMLEGDTSADDVNEFRFQAIYTF